MVTSAITDFDCRTMTRLHSDPLALLLLVKSDAHKVCEERRATAERLVKTPTEHLHITAAKVKTIFSRVAGNYSYRKTSMLIYPPESPEQGVGKVARSRAPSSRVRRARTRSRRAAPV